MAKNHGTPVGGPITTLNSEDRYETGYANLQQGGLHAYKSITEAIQNLTLERMYVPMLVSINEDPTNGIPLTIYQLVKYPLEDPANPGVAITTKIKKENWGNYNILTVTEDNWEDFFTVAFQANTFIGAYKEEFAPDYGGTFYNTKPDWVNKKQPPFPYSRDQAWNDANWSSTLEPGVHRWKRYAYGNGPWSYPLPLSGAYEAGDYKKNLYKWAQTQPTKPPFYVNGVRNSSPTGWSDTRPQRPSGTGYKLWEVTSQFSVYGVVKVPYSDAKLVPLDGDLVRYSSYPTPDPNTIVDNTTTAAEGTQGDTDLASEGWETDFDNESHVYKAQRELVSPGNYTDWEVDRMLNESGEYTKDWYRKFPKHLVNYILNNPDAVYTVNQGGDGEPFRPQNETQVNKWSDNPPTTGEGVTFVTTQKKFFNDAPAGPYSNPVPFSGQDTRIAVIEHDPVNDFKLDPNTGNYQVNSIDLTAKVYEGATVINDDANVTVEYTWTRIFNNAAADNTQFGNTQVLTVNTNNVDGTAIFECVQVIKDGDGNTLDTLTKRTYINDIRDGIDSRILALRSQGFLFTKKNASWTPTSLVINALAPNINISGNHVWEYINEVDYDASNPWTTLADTTSQIEITSAEFESHINGTASTYVIYRCTITDALSNTYQDEVKFHKTTIEDGQSTYAAILTNDRHTLPTDPSGNPIAIATAKTGYKLVEGTTDRTLDYEGVAVTVEDKVVDGGGNNTVTVNLKTDQGDWDANANSPALSDGTGTIGDFYRVTVAGSQDLGSGSQSFSVGDHVYYDGSVWLKSVNTVKILEWGTSVISAILSIVFSDDQATHITLERKFQITRQPGYEDALAVDADLDLANSNTTGFVFKPDEQNSSFNKTLKARVYKNQVEETGASLNDYTFQWYKNGSAISGETSQSLTITADQVTLLANYYVTVTETATSRTFTSIPIDITDLQEAIGLHVLYYMQTSGSSAPTKPTDTYLSYPETTAKDTWSRTQPPQATGDVLWKSEKRDNQDKTMWTNPQRVTGEKGDQGENGGFYWPWATWYQKGVAVNTPKTPSNSATDISNDGLSLNTFFTDYNGAINGYKKFYSDLNDLASDPNYDPTIHNIWITRRFYDRAVDGTLSAGGNFEQIAQLSSKDGKDGINGTDGTDGADGRAGNRIYVIENNNPFPTTNLVDGDWSLYKDKSRMPLYEYDENTNTWPFVGYIQGAKGDVGVGLEYDIQSDKVGVKREDETAFTYTPSLKGDQLAKAGVQGGSSSYSSPSGRWVAVDLGDATSKNVFINAYAKMENPGHGLQLRIERNDSASYTGGYLIDQSQIRYDNGGAIVGMAVVNINWNVSSRYIVLKIGFHPNDTGNNQRVSRFGLFVEQY